MTDRPPTDPAPRGADAPDFETPLAEDEWFYIGHNELVGSAADARSLHVIGHRVMRVKLVPVPAEATSGAEPSEEYQRGFSDGYDTAASISVTGIEGAVDVLDALVAEGEPCEHDTGHCSCKQRQALESVRTYLAALRTPPAPLPREGATVTERMVSHALIGAREEAMRRGVGMHLVAAERLTAALTPAAQPTTKTEK